MNNLVDFRVVEKFDDFFYIFYVEDNGILLNFKEEKYKR